MKDSIIYTLVFVALQVLVGIGMHEAWMLATGESITAIELIVTMAVFSCLVIAVFLLARWTRVSLRWLYSHQWTVLIWSVFAAVGLLIPFTWLQENLPELPNLIEDQQEMLMSNYWGYLAIGILAPLAEEIVFRGAILRTLLEKPFNTQHPALIAIVISAFLFALIHMNPAQMPFAFLAGLLLGWMYWRTGSILPGMAYHWANNSMAYIIYQAYPDPDMKLIDLFKGSQTHVYLAVFFSVLIFAPALYQLHLRMRKAA